MTYFTTPRLQHFCRLLTCAHATKETPMFMQNSVSASSRRNRLGLGLFAGLAVLSFYGCATTVQDAGIPDDSLGLSKASVYDVPAPATFEYSQVDPGASKSLGASYHTAPPQIPHTINDFVPVTRDNNMCVACHNTPDLIGSKLEKGQATPAPRSHYVEKTNDLYMGRWNCVQCHRPQANVPLLVESEFGQKASTR